MARFLVSRSIFRASFVNQIRKSSDQVGDLGQGAGKGGGAGGSIRAAGGAFGRKAAAEEERYFWEQSQQQLAALHEHHLEEIHHHKLEIERLQKEIDRHNGKIQKLKNP